MPGKATSKRKLSAAERTLTASELREIKACSDDARQILGIGKTKQAMLDAPKHIQDFLDKFANDKRKSKHSLEDLALYFGCLWGDALCLKRNWTWSFVDSAGVGGYAVVAPDKSQCVYTMVDMKWQLKTARRRGKTNSLLMFNLLAERRDEVATTSGMIRHSPGELAPLGRFPATKPTG